MLVNYRNYITWSLRWSLVNPCRIIRSEVSTHCCHIFPRLCAWCSCTIICPRFRIYPGKAAFPLSLCILIMCTHNRVHYGSMVVFVCCHIALSLNHHYTDASEDVELLKCLSGIFSRLSVQNQVNSFNIFHAIYKAVCIPLIYSLLMIKRICVFYWMIIIESGVWTNWYCLGLGHNNNNSLFSQELHMTFISLTQ